MGVGVILGRGHNHHSSLEIDAGLEGEDVDCFTTGVCALDELSFSPRLYTQGGV